MGFGGLLIVVAAGVLIANALRSQAPKPTASPSVSASPASGRECIGPRPLAPGREPGPFPTPAAGEIDLDHIYVARISTYCSDLTFKIDPRDAPEAARSFVFLARKKYFDGLTIDQLIPGLGAIAGTADPGYALEVSRAAPKLAAGDLAMVDIDSDTTVRVAARFAVLTGPNVALGGVRLGTPLTDDYARRNMAILQRIVRQERNGTAPAYPLYIVHIDIQEFSR